MKIKTIFKIIYFLAGFIYFAYTFYSIYNNTVLQESESFFSSVLYISTIVQIVFFLLLYKVILKIWEFFSKRKDLSSKDSGIEKDNMPFINFFVFLFFIFTIINPLGYGTNYCEQIDGGGCTLFYGMMIFPILFLVFPFLYIFFTKVKDNDKKYRLISILLIIWIIFFLLASLYPGILLSLT